MKIYKDLEKTQEIQSINLDVLAAGETKEYIYYVYNDIDAELIDLEFTIKNSEIQVVSAPKTIKAKETAELKIAWKAAVAIKQGVHAELHIEMKELWG